MRRTPLFLLAVLMMASLVAGCIGGSSAGDEDSLYVAVAGPLTGPCAQDGEAIKNGAQLAAKIINENGGIDGKQIKLVFEDDRSDPKEAANIANKLVNDSKVLAVIGHYNSSCTLAGAPIYNEAGLVELSAGSTSPAVSDAGPYTFRVIVTDAFQGTFVARWMVEDEGLNNVAILYENDDYGAGLRDVISTNVEELGGTIVAVESYYLGETKDFSPYITKIRNINPDALFIGGLYNEAALIAKQAAQVGWYPNIFAVDGPYNPAYITLGGEATEGTRLVGFFHPSLDDPMVTKFVEDYTREYDKELGAYEAYGYDAMLILAEAMEKGGADRESIKDYLTTLEGFKGVSGITSFDENGDSIKVPIKLVVKDGEFQVYGP